MNVIVKQGPLRDHLDQIEATCSQKDPSVQEILDIFGKNGHYLATLFLILPFLQPIPLFGLSTPFGFMIAVIAFFAYTNTPPKVPSKWAQKTVKGSTVLKIAEGSERIFEKLSFMLFPRWRFFFSGPFRLLNLVLLILNGILLALPLPIPFSNAFPAWPILFQALGHLEEDGLFILLSYLQTIACLLYFGLIIMGIETGIEALGIAQYWPF